MIRSRFGRIELDRIQTVTFRFVCYVTSGVGFNFWMSNGTFAIQTNYATRTTSDWSRLEDVTNFRNGRATGNKTTRHRPSMQFSMKRNTARRFQSWYNYSLYSKFTFLNCVCGLLERPKNLLINSCTTRLDEKSQKYRGVSPWRCNAIVYEQIFKYIQIC